MSEKKQAPSPAPEHVVRTPLGPLPESFFLEAKARLLGGVWQRPTRFGATRRAIKGAANTRKRIRKASHRDVTPRNWSLGHFLNGRMPKAIFQAITCCRS